MSHKLNKPCTDIKRADFVVEHNHKRGLLIKETDSAFYALEPWEKLIDDEVIDNTEEYEKEQAQIRADYIANLKLTAADVERAIYKAKEMDFEDIVQLVENNIQSHAELVAASQATSEETLKLVQGDNSGVQGDNSDVQNDNSDVQGDNSDNSICHAELVSASQATPEETLKLVQGDALDIDIKALKIELKANYFYRGNPYVDAIGSLLGFSKEMLDEFFETNDYTKLIS